jgi:tetratricopeptide (TPR) repeat protein
MKAQSGFETFDFQGVIIAASEALTIAPLEWGMYAHRGAAEAMLGEHERAIRDFRIARRLQPYFIDMCEYEGNLWLELDRPEYVMEAWTEALSRASDSADYRLRAMLSAAGSSPATQERLYEWSRKRPRYAIIVLASLEGQAFDVELGKLLSTDPKLEHYQSEERQKVFRMWNEKGDARSLRQSLLEHPEWHADGWDLLAEHYASGREFQKAFDIAMQFGGKPILPALSGEADRAMIERVLEQHPGDLVAGLKLYELRLSEGLVDEALAALRDLQQANTDVAYLPFLEAQLHARKRDWESAWAGWKRYAAGRRN